MQVTLSPFSEVIGDAGGWVEDSGFFLPFLLSHSFLLLLLLPNSFPLFLCGLSTGRGLFGGWTSSGMDLCMGHNPFSAVTNCAMEHFLLLWPSCSPLGVLRGATNSSSWLSYVCSGSIVEPATTGCVCHSATPDLPPTQATPAAIPCYLLFIPSTLEYENIVGGSVKSLGKVKVVTTHCSSLIHKTNHFILEGSGAGQA